MGVTVQSFGNGRRRATARLRRSTVGVLSTAVVVAACGGSPGPVTRSEGAARRTVSEPIAGSCTVQELDRRPLSVGGRDVFVEPHVFTRTSRGLILAGAPTYEWNSDDPTRPTSEANGILGLFLDADGGVRELARPEGLGPIQMVRALRLGPDRWTWMFEQVSSPTFRDMHFVGVSQATLTNGRWSEARPLPPAPGRGSFATWSPMVMAAGIPTWVLVERSERGGLVGMLYTHDDTLGWRSRQVDPAPMDAASLAVDDAQRLWMIASGLSETSGGSIRVGRLGPDGFDALHETDWLTENGAGLTRVSVGPGGVVAGWMVVGADGAEVWGTVLTDDIEPASYVIDDDSDVVVTLALDDGTLLWLVRHFVSNEIEELRVYRPDADTRPRRIATFPGLFRGVFAAIPDGGSDFLLVGPEVTEAPLTVRSLLLRMRVICE